MASGLADDGLAGADIPQRIGRANHERAAGRSASRRISNDSWRPSRMPSRGNAGCQRCASSEYSTRVTAESVSRTSAATMKRVPSRRIAPICTVGATLSISKLLLSSSPASAVSGGIRRRVRGDHLHDVGAVRHRRRVPHEQRVAQIASSAASTSSRLRGDRTRRSSGRRRSRRRPSRRTSAGPSDRCGGRAAGAAAGDCRAGAAALVRRVVVEAGDLGLAGRERLLEHDARRVDGDRRDLRPEVALQVRRRSPTSGPGSSRLPVSTARHCR